MQPVFALTPIGGLLKLGLVVQTHVTDNPSRFSATVLWSSDVNGAVRAICTSVWDLFEFLTPEQAEKRDAVAYGRLAPLLGIPEFRVSVHGGGGGEENGSTRVSFEFTRDERLAVENLGALLLGACGLEVTRAFRGWADSRDGKQFWRLLYKMGITGDITDGRGS